MKGTTTAPLWFVAGGQSFEDYQQFGGGAALFRAYLDRRAADSLKTECQVKRSEAALRDASPLSHEYISALEERLLLRILEELDPIIRDLLCLCDEPVAPEKQLRVLRRALRIGRGRSRQDVESMRRRESAIEQWEAAYRTMLSTGTAKSERAIAQEIANRLGITSRAAWGYWADLKKQNLALRRMTREVREQVRRGVIVHFM